MLQEYSLKPFRGCQALPPVSQAVYRFTLSEIPTSESFVADRKSPGTKRWVISVKDAVFLEASCVG